MFLTEDEVFIG